MKERTDWKVCSDQLATSDLQLAMCDVIHRNVVDRDGTLPSRAEQRHYELYNRDN